MNLNKTCISCGCFLTPKNWYESSKKTNNYLCIDCHNEKCRKNYLNNKEKYIKRANDWNNSEKGKNWRKNYKKEYYQTNKDRICEQLRFSRKDRPWNLCLTNIKQRCNNSKRKGYKYYGGKGVKCVITKEEIKKLWFRDKAYSMKRPSIDRIDNDGNYEYLNCRFIEQSENARRINKC